MADEVEDIRRLLMASDLNLMTPEAEGGLQMLRNDLRLFKAFAAQATGLRELGLDRQIKDVVYDLEDIFEFWLVAGDVIYPRLFMERQIEKVVYDLAGIFESRLGATAILYRVSLERERILARKIESIRDDRIKTLERRMRTHQDLLKVQTQPTEVCPEQPYKEVSSIEPCNIFEDEAEALIRNLMAEAEELDVISITGMPGIGKTTLARNIFQNKRIVSSFPSRIWVDIPLNFTRNHLYRKIIESCNSHDNPHGASTSSNGGSSDDILLDAVVNCLEKCRFLLVLDSVWTADTLDSILPFSPNNGKVLITSRHNHITRKPHLLRFLNERESWNLLQFAVFGKLNACSEMLKSAGECIAKNCDGSPLAIAVVANALMIPSDSGKGLNEKWWEKVSDNVTKYVTDYCAQQNVFKSIQMSYIKLPQHLRNCFIYLGVFPEGREIPVGTLTRLWIAEGLAQDIRGVSSEETAELNLYELINRNLVLVGKVYPNGQIKTCRLHKLMYGFCKYKADEKEFYHEIKISKRGDLDRPMPLTPNHRRLCINSCLSEFLSSGPEGPSVRSILCVDKADKEVLQPKCSSNIHKSFKLLKILECRRIKFAKFPTKLSRLKNLRYIALSCDDLESIPEAISSLCYLETLVVDTDSASVELKANMWRMTRLQHLVTNAAIVLAIRQWTGEAGKNLETLTRLSPECCTEKVFRKAPNLKTLGIRGRIADIPDALRKLESLENLKLINESNTRCLIPHLFPPTIRRLTLSETHLNWESMSVLGNIDALEILKLKNNAFRGGSWNTQVGGFKRLGFLYIGSTDLVSWRTSSWSDCFPQLSWLVLNNCEQLEEIPTLPETLKLDVKNVPRICQGN